MQLDYDIIIIGGGLSGLWAAIELSSTYNTLLIDSDDYPRHKLCGEYLSAEVEPLLSSRGIHLEELTSVYMDQFQMNLANGEQIGTKLPLGGYGISRFLLDQELFKKATEHATFKKDHVIDLAHKEDFQTVYTKTEQFTCKQIIVATGKRSLVDKKLDREFIKQKSGWLAIKMHYQFDMTENEVELNNFIGGYAGISKVEDGIVNLCYLTTYQSFKNFKNIPSFEEEVLSKNPRLAQFFKYANPIWSKPITISQISFGKRKISNDKYLFIGDSAGLIHPLCGNGMAMALHSAHLACHELKGFMEGRAGRDQMIKNYTRAWNQNFGKRMRMGSYIQRILLHRGWSHMVYKILSAFPGLVPIMIRKTHGKPIEI